MITLVLGGADILAATGDREREIKTARWALTLRDTPTQRLALARLLAAEAASGDKNAGEEADGLYRGLLANATGDIRTRILNEYGVLLLTLNQMETASRIFTELQDSASSSRSVADPDKARYAYNAGLAWDKMGAPEEALKSYATALELDPEFDDACDGIRDLARSTRESDAVIAVLEKLLWQRQYSCAGKTLKKLTTNEAWRANSAAFEPLLRLNAVYLAMRNADFGDYKEQLSKAVGACAICDQRLYAIDVAYTKPFPQCDAADCALALGGPWASSASDRAVYSALVANVARQRLATGDATGALNRFVAAWQIDPMNIESAIYAVDTYATAADITAAPAGLLTQLSKYGAVLDKTIHEKPIEARLAVRLHTILARAFEKLGTWEGIGVANAIAQWNAAIAAVGVLPEREREASAELYGHQAAAYAHAGRNAEAYASYLDGVEGYLSVKRWKEAELLLREADILTSSASDEQKLIAAQLAARVAASYAIAPATTSANDWEDTVRRWIASDTELSGAQIDVSRRGSVLYVSGVVPSQDASRRLQAVVRDLTGLKQIITSLHVRDSKLP